MKKNLIKKVFAVSLSIAMACSFLPAANPVTASAAAPFVSLKSNFKTLKVGDKYKVTLRNNTINWKIKKVETTDKTVATVYGKTSSQVMVKAKSTKGSSEARATIRVRLTTASRKTNNTKTLRLRVKVVPAATTPVDPTTPVQTDAEVKTQAELDAALSNSSITKITINPTTAVNFEIKGNAYPNVDLIVDAPLSDIDNAATFNSITINNIKAETWTERAKGNTFSILAKAARMVVEQTASVRGITIGTADATFNLAVNKGAVENVNVNAKSTVNITGTAAENAALINVVFGAAAADATFTTELPSAVSMSANINLTFKSGAVGSTVKLEVAGIKATIKNETTTKIVVTKNDGKTTEDVQPNSSLTVNAVATTTTTPGTSTTYPGSSVTKPTTSAYVVTDASIKVTGTITPGSITVNGENKDVVTKSAITVTFDDVITEKASASDVVEYRVIASGQKENATIFNKEIGNGTLTLIETYTDGKRRYFGECKGDLLNGVTYDADADVIITVELNIKETTTYAASSKVRFRNASGKMNSNLNFTLNQW